MIQLELFRRSAKHCRGNTRAKRALFKDNELVHCCYCEVLLSFENATVEHIVDRARGGPNTLDNLAISCKRCNNHKQGHTFEEWKAIVQSSFAETRKRTVRPNENSYMIMYNCLRRSGRLMERKYLR